MRARGLEILKSKIKNLIIYILENIESEDISSESDFLDQLLQAYVKLSSARNNGELKQELISFVDIALERSLLTPNTW